MERKKHAVLQIVLLFVIQWLSVAVIILNALALDSVKDSDQNLIIATKTGPQEFILLVIGAVSLFTSSLLLCAYLHILFRLLGNQPTTSSKKVLVTEIVLSFIIIALWTTSSIIISIHFDKFSSCQQGQIASTHEDSFKGCRFTTLMITAGIFAISIWVLVFLVSAFSLFKLIGSSNISGMFTMQQTGSTIHPYHSKFETNRFSSYSSTTMLNTHPSTLTAATLTAEKADTHSTSTNVDTNKADEEEGGLVKVLKQEHRIIIEDLQRRRQPYPQEPSTVATSRHLGYEFMEFEPIHLDLMLPSTSELLKDARKKMVEKNHYYHYS